MSIPAAEKHYLGIDIGSVSLGLVFLYQHKTLLHHEYLFHHGSIAPLLRDRLSQLDLSHVVQVSYNQRAAEFFAGRGGISVNDQLASIEGILFQRQQAERLGLSGSAELSRLAEAFQGQPLRSHPATPSLPRPT